jgi:hypothetical protein
VAPKSGAPGEPKREGGLGVGAWKRLGAGVVVGTGEMPACAVGVMPPKNEPLFPAPNRLAGGLLLKRDPPNGFTEAYCLGVSFA